MTCFGDTPVASQATQRPQAISATAPRAAADARPNMRFSAQMKETRSTAGASPKLLELVYELLDAHDDTTRLARTSSDEVSWAAHLDYLRRLQRVGREVIAASATDTETF